MGNNLVRLKSDLSTYLRRQDVLDEFARLMGDAGAKSYIQSVMIACFSNPDLLECTPDSIVRAGLRAASLKLSCDPAVKQAQLIPRTIKGVKQACFELHYNGLFTLAIRTGMYLVINVLPVYEGQRVLQHPSSGFHFVALESGMVADPLIEKGYIDVTRGRPKEKVIGYLGYYKTVKGFERTVYMTVEEIEEHAKTYAKSYLNERSLWQDDRHRATMQVKTALRELLRMADISGQENLGLEMGIVEDVHEEEDGE